MRPQLFCFGLGYSALALARLVAGRGFAVSGTVRSAEKAARLKADGIAAHIFDGTDPVPEALLDGVTHLLISVPPGERGDPVLAHHRTLLMKRAGQFAWAGYLSTTGVYGDRQGGLVDETSAPTPAGPRGRARVTAEAAWREIGLPLHIFRLAGIYGPGRNPLIAVKAGTARRIDKPGQLFSRIHREDLAETLAASMARPDPGRVYNVCDDEPAHPADVIAYAAGLLGMAPPPLIPLETAGLSPMALSFYDESKRVSNARIKAELGITLRYPSYREGLAALL
jgi:nucleoside-diphosphate-sugar epimerase